MRAICCAILAFWFYQTGKGLNSTKHYNTSGCMYIVSITFVVLAIIGCILGL